MASAFVALLSITSSSGCARGPRADGGAAPVATATSDTHGVTVHAVFDLPRTPSTQSLSGITFAPATRTLYAVPDDTAEIVPIVASEDFTKFTLGTPIPLTGRPDPARWDGEAIARDGDGFVIVTEETVCHVERFDASGRWIGAIALPAHYGSSTKANQGLESLAVSPSGRFLFTVNETALTTDGPSASKTRGALVRILRHDLATNVDSELAYRTEPLGAGTGGDMGVSELAAIDDDALLVLERGYQSDYGNTARIFRVDLARGANIEHVKALDDTSPVLDKTLIVDIGALHHPGVTNPSRQPNPILDNYEGLAIGPRAADGRRLVFVLSDDNGSVTQVPRLLVLAVPGL